MPMLSFLLACTILWAQVYTTSNCQAIMNIHLIVKNRCIGGYSAIINLNHKFIITFRTDVDFNINILKTKFPNSFGFQYFCKTTSYRTRGKYQSLNPTSLWVFTFQSSARYRSTLELLLFFFFKTILIDSIVVTFALEAHGPHHSPELRTVPSISFIKLFQEITDIYSTPLYQALVQ